LSLHHICMRFNSRLPKLRVNLFWCMPCYCQLYIHDPLLLHD
jgi:hypothetical protein